MSYVKTKNKNINNVVVRVMKRVVIYKKTKVVLRNVHQDVAVLMEQFWMRITNVYRIQNVHVIMMARIMIPVLPIGLIDVLFGR